MCGYSLGHGAVDVREAFGFPERPGGWFGQSCAPLGWLVPEAVTPGGEHLSESGPLLAAGGGGRAVDAGLLRGPGEGLEGCL